MRPEDRMAMAVVLGLAERAPGLAQSPETCEWIRQAVANLLRNAIDFTPLEIAALE